MNIHANRLLGSVENKFGIEKLLGVMQALRDPEGGCNWDLKQNYQSLITYTLEEVYEVIQAIENADFENLREELGDLLFQVVFYAQIAQEENKFDFQQLAQTVSEKLIRRHPHVFSDVVIHNDQELNHAWETQKQLERNQKSSKQVSLLDDIPKTLPELKRALKIQKRAAKGGFEWDDVAQVWDKLAEECEEVHAAVASKNQLAVEDEIGDLLFTVVNLARFYAIDADIALRKANQKFERRFRQVEHLAQQPLNNFKLDELEVFWQQAKLKHK